MLLLMAPLGASVARPGDDLQAILDSGASLALQKGAINEISETLRLKESGQKIYTKNARFPSEFATLRLVNKDIVTIVNGAFIEGAALEHVIFDGNRYELSVRPYPESGKVHQPGIANFGAADNQRIRECVFMHARGFSNIVFHRNSRNSLVENNIVLGAGVDARGNGREAREPPRRWSDGISCASHEALIRNNLIIDPTDVGIVLYSAPGSVVEHNVVASISRESLGGINLVDGFEWFALNEEKTLFDYRGSTVRKNYIDAFGARIHIAIPCGSVPWVASWRGKILTGGIVTGNTITGSAGAYGIVAHGITDWTITGNISTATYSGLAEYGEHKRPPDDPVAFIYDDETVVDSVLQPEFVKSQRHIEHLLRTHRAPEDANGYQLHDYGDPEATAVVNAAYLEMLGRRPTKKERTESESMLRNHVLNADGLRRLLMTTDEFTSRYGHIPPEALHPFRVKRWFDILDKLIRNNGGFPPALELYQEALSQLNN